MKLRAIVIALLLLCSNLVAATMPQGATPKGRIEGTIFKAGSKDPVMGVRVNVNRVTNYTGPIVGPGGVISASFSTTGPPPPPPPARGTAPPPSLPTIPSVVTDREGKFVVPDLDAGSYRISVTAPGYVKQEYGQRVFPGQGTVLSLTDGQVMKDLVINLILTGNVSGRLRDNFGQPAAGVPVQLLKPAYNAGGQKSFQAAGSTRTNDRGEYRIYWVTPGRYVVTAGSPPGPAGGIGGGGGGQPATPNDPGYNYQFSFYPGVRDASAANSIEVTPGNEISADFLVPQQEVHTIRGRAIDATTNQPPASLITTMQFANLTGGGASWSMIAGYTPSTGAFQIRDVVPGSYTLQLSSPTATSRTPLEVVGPVENLTVVLNGGGSLSGRLAIDGLDQTGLERFLVQLRAVNATFSSANSGAAGSDGTFKLENLAPGDYYVAIVVGTADYFVKSARFDRDDVLNQPLKISGSIPGGATLDVVVSPNVGQVSGVVTDERLQPMGGVQAVLVPDKNRDRPDFFRAVATDQSGRFVINGVVPGDYRLFSWESLESYGYFDPDLLKKSEMQGKTVHVGESSKQQINVRVIPASK